MSPPPAPNIASDSLWRNRPFLTMFLAQAVSLLGSGVTTVALALFAYELTGGEAATAVIGNASMLRIAAFLLFSQPAGVIADRVSRKKILIAADLGRFALLFLFPFVTQVWQVYVLIFAVNAFTAWFTPAYESSLPQVVGDTHYVKALSVSRVAVDLEAIGGPATAGLLVALFGVRWVFWFDGLTYLLSAALLITVSIPTVIKSGGAWWRGVASDIPYGARLLLRQPALVQALVVSFAEATAGAAAIVVTVTYVRDSLGRGELAYAGVMVLLGVGSSLTAVLLSRFAARSERGLAKRTLHNHRHRWAARSLLIGGMTLAAVLLPGAWRPPLVVFAMLWMANGVGQALIAIPSSTLLALHTEQHERGRAYAAHFALTHACWLITYPAVGYAAMWWGPPLTFTIAGVACLFATALAWAIGLLSRTPKPE